MGQINRYERRKQIGEGRSGVVFEARDLALDRDVAFKFLREGFHLAPGIKRQLLSSGSVGPALVHPNISALYDIGQVEGSEYVITELLTGTEGGNTNGLQYPFSLLQKMDFMARICDGMAHAHGHGILHLNIHPGNVFIQGGHDPKILDFGIGRTVREEREAPVEYSSASDYQAPEYLMGARTDFRSDLYSLALVFMDFVFSGDTAAADHSPLTCSIRTLLERAVEKNPDDRIQSAKEFADGIRAIAAPSFRSWSATNVENCYVSDGEVPARKDWHKTFVPSAPAFEPASIPAPRSLFARLRSVQFVSPTSRKVGGLLMTALLVLGFVVAVSETLRLRLKSVVARSEVQVGTATLFEAPNEDSRHIRSLGSGSRVDVLEQPSFKHQQFVHVQYLSSDGSMLAGYLHSKDLGNWTSEDPETSWRLVSFERPTVEVSPDESRAFIRDVKRFLERFPQSPHAAEAELDLHRFTVALAKPEGGGIPDTVHGYFDNGQRSLSTAAEYPALDQDEADKLLKRVPELWDSGDVDAVLALSNQILATDPNNIQAKRWRLKANKALKELGGQ